MQYTIYTDGGSRSNPGKAAIGIVVKSGEELVHQQSEYLGIATNNEAEYQGFIYSLKWLLEQDLSNIEKVTWKLDSKLVVEQLSKRWKIKEPRLQMLAQGVWKDLQQLALPYSIVHIPRAENALADALVNITLDAQQAAS